MTRFVVALAILALATNGGPLRAATEPPVPPPLPDSAGSPMKGQASKHASLPWSGTRSDGWRHPGRGRVPPPLPSAKSVPTGDSRTLSMVATAYTPGPESCGDSADGITSTGHRAGPGIAAVDPRVIPLGSLLYVEEYGYAWALDVGGAIRGDRVDLCFDRVCDARRWGRRRVEVVLLPLPRSDG